MRQFMLHRSDVAPVSAATVSLLLMLAIAVTLTLIDIADGVLYLGDVDDQMRAFQIRDLLTDHRWFDPRLELIQMPEMYHSPWSRLVDLPYFILISLLTPLAGAAQAFGFASAAVPLLLLAAFVALNLATMRNLAGSDISLTSAFVTTLAMALAFCEFSPGRIDHHSFQLVAMAAMFATFTSADARHGGWGGAAIVMSFLVGLECMPFIAIVLAFVALGGVFGSERDRQRMMWTGIAMTGLSAPAALVFNGTGPVLATLCDQISAPYITALTLTGAIYALAPMTWSRFGATGWRAAALRMTTLALPGLAMIAVLVVLFPACLDGPFPMIDDISRVFWFERIAQERSSLSFIEEGKTGLALTLAAMTFIALMASRRVADGIVQRDWMPAMVLVTGIAALLATFLLVRYVRFAPAFLPLFLPWLIDGGIRGGQLSSRVIATALAVCAVTVGVLFATVKPVDRGYDAIDLMTWDECTGADFSVLTRTAPGKIMAPLGLSFGIGQQQVAGFSIAGLSFHRASPGIRRIAQTFTSDDSATRRAALAGFDYVAICRRDSSIDLSGAPLYGALALGKDWPGLVEVENGSAFRLFRIERALLQ